MNQRIGYKRVFTADQHLDPQVILQDFDHSIAIVHQVFAGSL